MSENFIIEYSLWFTIKREISISCIMLMRRCHFVHVCNIFFSSDFGEAWKWIIRTEPWFSAMLLFSCNQFRTLCTMMAEAAHSMNAWVTFGEIPKRMWLLNECPVLLTLESFEPIEEVSVIVGKFILKLRFLAVLIFVPNFYVIEKYIYKVACWYLDPFRVLKKYINIGTLSQSAEVHLLKL